MIPITGTKLGKTPSALTQSVSVITDSDLEDQAFTSLLEALRQQAGIEFKRVGGPGQYGYLKMRGFSTAHVLLVIDGIVIQHDAAPDGIGAILNKIAPESVENIEILRGPQAAIYGANSTAGVIVITTKDGAFHGNALNLGVQVGSLQWSKQTGSARAQHELGSGSLDYAANVSQSKSEGIVDHDYSREQASQLKLGYAVDSFRVKASYWHTRNQFNYAELIEPFDERTRDNIYGFQISDPNQRSKTVSHVYHVALAQEISPSWSHQVLVGQGHSRRQTEDPNDGILGVIRSPEEGFSYGGNVYSQGEPVLIQDQESDAKYREQSDQISYAITFRSDDFAAILGFEQNTSDSKQEASYLTEKVTGEQSVNSGFLNLEYQLNQRLVVAGGVRQDTYKHWQDNTSGSFGLKYGVPAVAVFANYSTSYKVPSLDQTTGNYGRGDLSPETGTTYELGLRGEVANSLSWELTHWNTKLKEIIYFDQSLDNPRAWNGKGMYNNGAQQKTQGIEARIEAGLTKNLRLTGNYTHTDSRSLAKGPDARWKRTVEIAKDMGNLGLQYKTQDTVATINVYHSGPRLRWNGDVELKPYNRVDLAFRYDFSPRASGFVRIENLQDVKIEEGFGYESQGLYAITGFDYDIL